MTVIGLTGGIAAGKSTAADVLREFGATVIDADRLGHRSYEPGTPGFQKVVNAFGHDIVGKDGNIDRRVLGGKVFGAPGQLERLNAIVWPEIRALIKDEVKQIRAQEDNPVIVLEAAVLLEAGWQDLCDEVWVVLTSVKTAVTRLKERNNLAEDAAMARINAQMTNKERAAMADVKIDNDSTEEQLRARVERAWKSFMSRHRPKTKGAKATKTGSVKADASKPADATSAPKSPPAKAAAKAPAKATTTRAAAAKPAAKATTSKATTVKPRAATPKKPSTKAAAKPATKAAATKAAAPKAAGKVTAKAPSKATAAKPAARSGPAKTSAKAAAKPAAKSTSKPAGTRSK
ncbi:MAG: dephospho-CoA kinase [Dehalococcoidia bacterium]